MAITALALSLACAVLSVIVVLRRWAFIGEGISHSGIGGAGTAWLLMLAFPAMDQPWVAYVSVVIFCLVTAIAIGALCRGRAIQPDAAIGIFMVASLAWGFLAQGIYFQQQHKSPALWETLLFGQLVPFSFTSAVAAAGICLVVVVVVVALWKEIIAYSFDPLLAQTSGVRAGFIHYLLMVLVALVIIVGVRVAGSVLVTALLVLPGATALLLSHKLNRVLLIATFVAMTGTFAGLLVGMAWKFLPAGPCIVLIMFIEFVIAYTVTKLPRRAAI